MKSAVITGANRGIGLCLAKQLSEKGYQITALCRQGSDELNQLSNTQIIDQVELSEPHSIQQACESISDRPIDLLINNAGRLRHIPLSIMDTQNIEEINTQFHINALAPLLVTHHLKASLNPGAKVALITSRMGSIEDNQSGSHYAYRMSKAALNAAGKSLSIDLKSDRIAVAILHPGWIQTDMTGHSGNDTPENAARDLFARIDALTLDQTGTFWHANGEVLPW